MLLDAGCEFWEKHVLAEVPPPLDASATWARHLGKKFAVGSERVIEATAEYEARALHQAQVAKAEAEKQEALAKNHLMEIVGEAKAAKGSFGRATWVRPRPSESTDWEAVAKAVGASAEMIALHTEPRNRTAYLKVTFSGKED
jgi:predicted phage-related endonuclease